MIGESSVADRISNAIIYAALLLLAVSCLVPFMHLLAKSSSSQGAIATDAVGLWPIGFNLDNYGFLTRERAFLDSLKVSVMRVLLGVLANLAFAVITAYPLSLDNLHMPGRTAFKVFMLAGMLFSTGLIPMFLTLKMYGLLNRFAVLILPGILSVFNTILVINFFRGIPQELREAATIDGASHLDVLFRIYIPLSRPVLATVGLFFAVGHWNSWFDALIYINLSENWPLQSYLYSKIIQAEGMITTIEFIDYRDVTPEALKAALIFVSTIPIMLVYPFLQRHFVKGLTLGAIKG